MKTQKLFKVLVDGKSCHGGNLAWNLPKGKTTGEWHDYKGDLKMCESGLHVTTAPEAWWKPNCKFYLAEAEGISGEQDNKLLCRRVRLVREVAIPDYLQRVDAFVTAAALNVADRADPSQPDRLVSAPSITMPFSVGGLPTLAIPCGFSGAEGLPLSLQIAAGPFAEGLVLRIAHAYQEATDWHRRDPDLA
jgi:Asp-tRNA(Asn)/Glu-tRNA(Gln) amidotransferase A subunit family amidase